MFRFHPQVGGPTHQEAIHQLSCTHKNGGQISFSLEVIITAFYFTLKSHNISCLLATNPSGQLDVFGHDGHSLGMDGAPVSILEEADKECLSGLLKGSHSRSLKSQLPPRKHVLRDLSNQPAMHHNAQFLSWYA